MDATAQVRPQAMPPALLARLVDEVDRVRGAGLIPPVLRLTLLTAIPSLLLGWTMELVRPGAESPAWIDSPFYAVPTLLVVAPALETVLMRVMFSLVGRMVSEALPLNLICALLWGFMRQDAPGGGIHAVWTFYVMGAVFLRLQSRSENRAYAVVIALHALFNAIAYGVYMAR